MRDKIVNDSIKRAELSMRLYDVVWEEYKAKLAVEKDQRDYASRGQLRQNYQLPSWPAYDAAAAKEAEIKNEIIALHLAEYPERK